MKKRTVVSLILAIVMMFAMFPVAAFAAEGNGAANVVRVTVSGNSETVEFASLQEALDFATAQSVGCTVYILDNITLTEPIVYRDSKADNVEMQSIKTGVNTYKLTSTFDEPMFTVEAGRFSIKNLVISSKGDAFQINGGSLALQGAYQGKQELYITSENGNCLSVAGGNTSIRANVYMTSNGREPVIAGTAGVGGNVTFHDWVATDPGVPQLTAPNAAMLISWPGEGTLSITQGYLDGENVVEPISDNVSITGGTFTAKPANWMIEDGYYCLPTADGKIWGVYPGTISVDDVWFASFDDAKASIKKDSKIVLYADAESNYGVGCAADYHFPGAGNLTLELNGFQFHSVKPADNKGTTTISMGPNSTLTITDSVGTGSIVFDNKGHPLVLSNNSKLYLPETIEFVGTIQLNYTNAQVFLGDTCILGQGGLVQTNVWGTKQFNNVNLDAEGNVVEGWTQSDWATTTKAGEADVHTKTVTISEEGDYQIKLYYQDHSLNEQVDYLSQWIVVDKTAPVIQVKYATP